MQVVDLEGLAAHRGSLLGGMADPQPAQKAFETALATRLNALDPARPVLVEAESSKIGERILPPVLWEAMKAAPRIEVTAPVSARAEYLARAYDDILSDPARLSEKLNVLRAHRGNEVVDGWMAMIAQGDRVALTRALAEQHYDPSYNKSRRATGHEPRVRIAASALNSSDLQTAADQIEIAVDQLSSSDKTPA